MSLCILISYLHCKIHAVKPFIMKKLKQGRHHYNIKGILKAEIHIIIILANMKQDENSVIRIIFLFHFQFHQGV